MMIKKVPFTHLALYVLNKIELTTDEETGIESLARSVLTKSIEQKFKFSNMDSKEVARFLVEGPATSDEDTEVLDQDYTVDKETFMKRVREHILSYNVLNGLAITSMLTRLQGIMEGNLKEFAEDVGLQDDD